MKTRLIAVLSLTLVCLGLLYYLDYRRIVERASVELQQSRLLPFEIEAIDAIAFENQFGKYRIERHDEGWRLTEPVQEDADDGFVRNTLLDRLDQAVRYSPIEISEADRAAYGLDEDAIRIRIESDTRDKNVEAHLGGATPIQGEGYLELPAQPGKVWATSLQLREAFSKNLLALRDKKVFPSPPGDVFALDILCRPRGQDLVSTPRLVSFQRDEAGDWNVASLLDYDGPLPDAPGVALEQSAGLQADPLLVEHIVNALAAMTPAGDESTATLPLTHYGLADPPLTIQLHHGEARRTRLALGTPPPLPGAPQAGPRPIFARNTDRDLVFQADPRLTQLLGQPVASFRDRRIFRLDPAEVAYLQIQILTSSIALERGTGGEWRLAASPETEVHQGRVQNYFSLALPLRVASYQPRPQPADAADAGLEPANIRIMLADAERRERETLEVGRRLREESPYFYARRADAPDEIFAVEIPAALYTALLRTGEYFARRPLLAFEPGQVRRVEALIGRDAGASMTLRRAPSGQWEGFINDRDAKALPDKTLDQFLETLAAIEYRMPAENVGAEQLELYGLDPPALVIRLIGEQDRPLASFGVGKAEEGSRLTLIRRNGNEFFYVPPQAFTGVGAVLDEILARLR